YRFFPRSMETPFEGRLQALAVARRPRLDTSRELRVGEPVEVSWVDIDEPDPKKDTVRYQGRAKGAAIVKRGEGIWIHDDDVFICSTSGGPRSSGQIFRLSLGRGGRSDRLTLLAQSTDTDVLNMPDNIAMAPWGDLFLCEDCVAGEQHLRVLGSD